MFFIFFIILHLQYFVKFICGLFLTGSFEKVEAIMFLLTDATTTTQELKKHRKSDIGTVEKSTSTA
jgi:hypothetical protein